MFNFMCDCRVTLSFSDNKETSNILHSGTQSSMMCAVTLLH